MIKYAIEAEKFKLKQRRKISAWIKVTAAEHHKQIGDIQYIFTTNEEILRINRSFLKHDYYTDIITFDYTEGDVIGGDIFISVDTVRANAEEYGTTFLQELMRVVIHGVLHLIGYNDKSDEEQVMMRRKEDEALERLAEMTD